MYTQLCTKLWVAMDRLKRDERGVTAIEYAVLAAMIIAALVGVIATGENGFFGNLFGELSSKATEAMGQ